MNQRQLSILIELSEDFVLDVTVEKALVDTMTLIFNPSEKIDMRRYVSRSFHPCIEIYMNLEVSDTQLKMVKKIKKQIDALRNKMRKLLLRGAEIEVHLSQRGSTSEFEFTWEMGSSSIWKILEIVHG